jgi:DNA-binding NarL/FixJ family response regulator
MAEGRASCYPRGMNVPAIQSPILLRVLVADSGSSINDGLTSLLSDFEGLSVFGCVQDSAKVTALVRTVHPDVVILDLQMAGPIGLQTLKQIKSLPHPPVVIVLSAYDTPPVRRAALAAGADHYLVKTECGRLQEVLGSLLREKGVPATGVGIVQ